MNGWMFRQLVGWSAEWMDKRMDMQLDGWMNQQFDAIDIQLKARCICKYVKIHLIPPCMGWGC